MCGCVRSQKQVRGHVLQTIKERGMLTPKRERSLLLRAADSLILQHLQALGYEYTASIFVHECGARPVAAAVALPTLRW